MNKLTRRQARFCEEYIIDLNATQAAIRAGMTNAGSLIQLPQVRKRIQQLMDKRSKRTAITADKVLEELARVAFVDIREYYDDEGNLLPIKELSKDAAAALSGAKSKRAGEVFETVEIKMNDKLRGLEMLGKHLKLFSDRVEHTGADGGPIEVETDNDLARRIAYLLRSSTP